MQEDYSKPESGMTTLFTKTFLILYSGLLAFISGGRADATPLAPGTAQPLDEAFIAKLHSLKRKPQLVLKLNMANLAASKAMMHTSHRSHSSHYSSSGGGHSSHSSHSSHYSSSTYSPSSGSSYTPSFGSSTPRYTPSRRSTYTPSRSRSSSLPAYRSTRGNSDTEFVTVYTLGDRVLRLGDRGSDVIALQQLLIVAGYSLIIADGDFGLSTNAAVKSFQEEHGLPADGVVGAQTIAALR